MAIPKYAQRIARLPELFELLAAHPNGLPVDELAAKAGVPVAELREDLLAFYAADVNPMLLGLSRPAVLEFVAADGADEDPTTAEVVRVVDERPADELGMEHVDASELALIYTAGSALLEMEPDDEDLRGAVEALTETMFGERTAVTEPGHWTEPVQVLEDATAAHQRVRIVYSRTWEQGVTERVIEPYRLVQTRRGWEVDAGPPDEDGDLRTFLVSNIREYDVLEETFEPPAELEVLLAANRKTTTVQVRLPHSARWAADFFGEQARVVEDDEPTVTLDVDLLPPLEHRLGLLLLVAGPDASVIDPPRLVTTAPRLAAELLRHHRGSA